jgi:hypothetical protein
MKKKKKLITKTETPCITIINKNVFFSKVENRKVKQFLSGNGTSRRRQDIRKGCRSVNIEEILCVQV